MCDSMYDFEIGCHTHVVFVWDSMDGTFEEFFFESLSDASFYLKERLEGASGKGYYIEPKDAGKCFIAVITHTVSVNPIILEVGRGK